jgi:hypothetical protein
LRKTQAEHGAYAVQDEPEVASVAASARPGGITAGSGIAITFGEAGRVLGSFATSRQASRTFLTHSIA